MIPPIPCPFWYAYRGPCSNSILLFSLRHPRIYLARMICRDDLQNVLLRLVVLNLFDGDAFDYDRVVFLTSCYIYY
jgi:hypothetical protein